MVQPTHQQRAGIFAALWAAVRGMRLHEVLAVVLLSLVSVSAQAAGGASGPWEPLPGDRAVVDLSMSIVYLVHENGEFLALDGLTGQKRIVAYDGIVYNAATPAREWEIRADALEKKGRSMTFGEGRFLRLSWPDHRDLRRGNESTAYGFHSHLTFAKMLKDKHEKTGWDKSGTGHRSMGCILLSEDDLTLVQNTWQVNGGVLRVSTQASVDVAAFTGPSQPPSWIGWITSQ